jgi:uncharacterized protein (UPF0297 family)
MRDQIVEQVVQKYQERSAVGIRKYGTTLEGNNTDDFLEHALEEAMDFSLYIMKIQSVLKAKGYSRLEDIPDFKQ